MSEWLTDAKESSGKPARLEQLCRMLEVSAGAVMPLRYQLLHRPVAALLEARRFGLARALFFVQHFASPKDSLADYQAWARLLGVEAQENRVHRVGCRSGIDLCI